MCRYIIMIFCLMLATQTLAGRAKARYNPSNDPHLDNLVLRININYNQLQDEPIGRMYVDAYHNGISECERQTWLGHLLRNILPFQTSKKKSAYALEALSHVRYEWPGDVQYNTVAMRANKKRHGKMMLKDAYECLLPMYDMRRKGAATRSFVAPFTDEGLKRYRFAIIEEESDSIYAKENPHLCRIAFWPVTKHHTLMEGEALVDSVKNTIASIQWKGRIDFAKAEGRIDFKPDSAQDILFPSYSSTILHYNWLGAKASNRYTNYFTFTDYTLLDSIDRWHQSLDLTPTYQTEALKEADFDTIRAIALSSYIDSLLTPAAPHVEIVKDTIDDSVSDDLVTIATGLVDGANIGDENNRFRIYGPLDPTAFGYNKIDGFSIREKFRWDRRFKNDGFLQYKGYIGFAFKQKELRYSNDIDWEYKPERRQKLSFEASCRGSSFSSKFIKTINEAIKEEYSYPDSINFYSLGVDYYRHYQFQLEHSNEVTNGLMLYIGANYNYRIPVKHGRRAVTKHDRDELIKSKYCDFSPFIRLEWTPRQYYVMEGKRKIYISSPTPTLSLELSQAIRNILNAESDYRRLEFDIHQDVRIRPSRVFAYHVGTGTFYRQRGEYFINYRYFSRHMYTSQKVEDRLGGAFQLLDDYWYSSSPTYVQTHFMYATPFGFIHNMPQLSKYAIQERFYLGNLWSKGKKGIYTEMGYGFSNNYFSLGLFAGFTRYKFYSAGIKFNIEIGEHL